MKKPVIIDTDPGIDDALALFLAFASEELDIKGILTVSGNQSIEKTTTNAINLLHLAGKEMRLIRGAENPLVREKVFAADIHGESGLGSLQLEEGNLKLENNSSAFIYEVAKEHSGELEIIALGPLTNIAKAVLLYPDLKDYVKRIVLMGGGHAFGNITPSAEFNIYADPEGAKIVFESGIPLVMVGLDATHEVSIKKDEVETLFQGNSPKEKILKQLLYDLITSCEKNFPLGGAHLHDLLAVIASYDESVITGSWHHVDIETKGKTTYGKAVVDVFDVSGKEKNALVAFHANKNKVMDIIREKFKIYA